MDHLKKLHTNPETENRDGNSDSYADSWELPSSTPSNTPENTDSGDAARNSDPGVEPDPSDELPNTSVNEADEAEASLGTSIRRHPSRAHHPPDYYSQQIFGEFDCIISPYLSCVPYDLVWGV